MFAIAIDKPIPQPRQAGLGPDALDFLPSLTQAGTALLGNRSEAGKAVQVAYRKTSRTFDPGASCRSQLFRTLFQEVDRRRRAWWRRSADGRRGDPRAALRRMPPRQAEVVLLADVEEMSSAEIQETTGLPEETIRSLLGQARRRLRAELATGPEAA